MRGSAVGSGLGSRSRGSSTRTAPAAYRPSPALAYHRPMQPPAPLAALDVASLWSAIETAAELSKLAVYVARIDCSPPTILYASARAAVITGRPVADLIGQLPWMILREQDWPTIQQAVARPVGGATAGTRPDRAPSRRHARSRSSWRPPASSAAGGGSTCSACSWMSAPSARRSRLCAPRRPGSGSWSRRRPTAS